MMNSTLFKLHKTSVEWQLLIQKLIEESGNCSEEMAQEISDLVNSSKSTIEEAIYAKRNIELVILQAKAQAKLIQEEYESVKATIDRYENVVDKINSAVIPIVERTGNISTNIGLIFIRRTPKFSFSLRDGIEFFELDPEYWVQPPPTFRKSVLRDLAKNGKIPADQIVVTTSETVSLCLKVAKPATRNIEPFEHRQEGAA